MQEANRETVLGNFENAEFDYFGFRTRFFRKGTEYWVRTDGPDGVATEYQVEFTFGVDPLQQYLIRLNDGRMQALSVAWDCKAKKWFHLHPDQQVTHQSALHWTGPQYNWNFMCAECHSTGVSKGYHPDKESYDTTYAEVNVACEACHGPGSHHPGQPMPGELAGRGPWTPGSPPRPAHEDKQSHQVETCARCHSRRSVLNEDYQPGQPIAQTHKMALIEPGLYQANGAIEDEVFEVGSFMQSKMYRAGVVCTDCHDPHTSQLVAKGDALCLQCHLPDKHSRHTKVSCTDCHMPGKFYMVKDYRHDHAFQVPGPQACQKCHQSRPVEKDFRRLYGEPRDHFGRVFAAAWAGDPAAAENLDKLVGDPSQPAIVRASAVGLLAPKRAAAFLNDPEPLVRREAVRAVGQATEVAGLQNDPVRSIRVEVGRLQALSGLETPAVREYLHSLEINSDRAETLLEQAEAASAKGQLQEAEARLRKALTLAPRSPQPYVNLADFYRAQGREDESKQVLDQALKNLAPPYTAPVYHAAGLQKVRHGDLPGALESLSKAARLAPEETHFAYVHALALDGVGQRKEALAVLDAQLFKRPRDPELLAARNEIARKLK